ncbi:MAG TPA: hypothetical protein VGR62_07560 [Candidatus Binatia bacterium]|jgi:uncharacterized membrane protein YebE (DUF533 family)|nr:hypothetical protein [Candidatus Binatia bacterium]
MTKHPMLILAGVLMVAAPALAERTINERMNRQDERIDNGAEDGKLTPKEYNKLEHREDVVQDKRADAKADGVVTHHERKEIRKAQDKTGAMIRKEKHDGQDMK